MNQSSKVYYNGSANTEIYASQVCQALMATDFPILENIAEKIVACKAARKTVYLAGNGGSAATASHLGNDLIKGCRIDDQCGFRAICLNDSSSVVTCLANDFAYSDVYSIQLDTLGEPGDLLIVFSGSGNSDNILKACETARKKGITTIGFGGRNGGKMKDLCDIALIAPTFCMEQIEDLHIIYCHDLITHVKSLLRR